MRSLLRILTALACSAAFAAAAAEARAQPRFEPTLESLKSHEVPDWYHDAKLGIFIHWGLYSVPAWATPIGKPGDVDWPTWFKNNAYAEWYSHTLRIPGSPTREHHDRIYGSGFGYYDFAPEFDRESAKWKPAETARLIRRSGARYVVLTTKHSDGYLLWPSATQSPHLPAGQRMAKRDLVGEMAAAVRKEGLRFGVYYSGGVDWSFKPVLWDGTGTWEEFHRVMVPEGDEYAAYARGHLRELIARYRPSILWNDIGFPKGRETLQLIADYYNSNPEGVIDDRWSVEIGDFTTPEYQHYDTITARKWESTRGLGYSFGYNRMERAEHMLSVDELVDFFVDVVSKNGNLLLNIGPRADGSVSKLQSERILGLGKWLATNGEGIYGSRPWRVAEGAAADKARVRFTRKNGAVYAFLLDHPAGRSVTFRGLRAGEGTTISMLGARGPLRWENIGDDCRVWLPRRTPRGPALGFRFSRDPTLTALQAK
jgi:alpha-L-fucosidase